MPFHFTCPYCFKKTLVHESIAGQSGPCASCGKTITVPEPPALVPESIKPVNSRYVESRQLTPKRQLLAWLLKAGGLVGGVLLVSGICLYLLWPTFQGLKSRRDRVASLNNLQRIAKALNEYALEHGTYPTPVVTDAKGQPMYSWRVLILEQLGEPGLAASFNKNLPWDAPENANLLANCPSVFISPAATNSGRLRSESNYALITGNNTLFPSSGPLRPGDITDGRNRTLLVVETSNTTSEWTRPWDIDASKLNTKIGSSGPNSIGGVHEGGGAVVFADEKSGWLPEDLSPALLRGLISPVGGEAIAPEVYYIE